MPMIRAIQEKLLFLNKFLRAPKQIGSVTPSSMFLAKKMVEQVPWHTAEVVVELGAGTGAITKYMDMARKKDTKMILFEKDAYLCGQLATQFPDWACYPDASKMQAALQREGVGQADSIVSGLPFFNFPQTLRDQLMHEIVASLKPGGRFIAFQYSQQMRKQLDVLFEIEQVHFVPYNIPPAFVYVCRKRE